MINLASVFFSRISYNMVGFGLLVDEKIILPDVVIPSTCHTALENLGTVIIFSETDIGYDTAPNLCRKLTLQLECYLLPNLV